MKIEKSKIIIYIYILIVSIILYLFNNIYVFCIIEIGLIILMCVILKFDIKHPMTLFAFIFVIYQIAFPIINYNGIVIFQDVTINENYYLCNWLATVSLIIFFGKIQPINYENEKIYSNINIKIVKIMYAMFTIIAITSSMYVIDRGYTSKFDIANTTSLLLRIGNMSYTILIPLTLYFFINKKLESKYKIIVGIISLLTMFVGMLTFGERSFAFNLLVVTLVFYFTVNKVTLKKIIMIGTIAILFISISSSLKMAWIKGINKQETTNMILSFLNSDFSAAGFNFNYLLNNNFEGLKGKSYIYDFLTPIDDLVPQVKNLSSAKWYKNNYWATRKTGLGFSIIAEGYANFRIIGIVLEMFIFARIIKFMYINSNKNSYYYVIYLGFLSLCMYACRQDLANVISPLFKYNILLAIVIFLISKREKGTS